MIPRIPRIMPNIPAVHLRASTSMFFDRAAVKSALSDMHFKALSKASMLVKDRAKRIIKPRGLARIPFKLQKEFPGAGPTALHNMGGMLGKTWTRSAAAKDRIIREIRFPRGSPPGTPPFTHTPFQGHPASLLGFRRNLWNYYDRQTRSAVVGPSKKGKMLPFLHEFGGTTNLRTWVFISKYQNNKSYLRHGGMKRPIVMKLAGGKTPKNADRWRPLDQHESATYPARPFMLPAMQFCVANGSIARAFRGQFTATGGSGGPGFTIRRG